MLRPAGDGFLLLDDKRYIRRIAPDGSVTTVYVELEDVDVVDFLPAAGGGLWLLRTTDEEADEDGLVLSKRAADGRETVVTIRPRAYEGDLALGPDGAVWARFAADLGRVDGTTWTKQISDPRITVQSSGEAATMRLAFDAQGRAYVLTRAGWVLAFDAAKHSATMVVADAREALVALGAALDGWHTDEAYQNEAQELDAEWQKTVDLCYHRDNQPLPAQTEVFGALNELMDDYDVVINAAGSMPGDLQCLWRARTPEQYHLEYAFSCMGYEIPAALGVKLAVGDDHEVVAIVGDGTYQMLPMEIATMAQEGLKVIIVLLQNHGFASIGALSESRGSQRFGCKYKMRSDSGRLDGADIPFDLAANAASWGADVLRCNGIAEFRENYVKAAASDRLTVLYIETNLYGPNPPGTAWWDVPVSQTSELESTRVAYEEYVAEKAAQRHYL